MYQSARRLRFIDLFAGIGGTRLSFEEAGCTCVFSSEWNRFAKVTYEANFGEIPEGDIRQIPSSQIPDHDILVGGFPCQPFSISGVSKKNSLGVPHGFDDSTQGTLFFEVKRILMDKRPRAFLLENVKHILRHDNGRTFRTIIDSLTADLDYTVFHKIIDARSVVPQHRERMYIVGFASPAAFEFPDLPSINPRFRDILEPEVAPKYTLSDNLWRYLQQYALKHKALGNGFSYGLTPLDGMARTLSARYYKDGSEILVPQGPHNPRRLTPRECARLMGFPDSFKFPVSDMQAYKQFGNSVVVPVVTAIARNIVQCLSDQDAADGGGRTTHVSQLSNPACTPVHSVGGRQLQLYLREGHTQRERDGAPKPVVEPSLRDMAYFRSRLIRWFAKHGREYPWRTSADQYRLLVAELMLRRTKADQVKVVYDKLLEHYPDAFSLAEANEAEVEQIVHPLGLRWRTPAFQSVARELKAKYDGKVPESREELKTLAGVGDYVAGAVLSIGYGLNEWIADANVVRVFKRHFGIRTSKEGRRDLHVINMARIYASGKDPRKANLAILDFAALICTPRNPKHTECPLRNTCKFYSPPVSRTH